MPLNAASRDHVACSYPQISVDHRHRKSPPKNVRQKYDLGRYEIHEIRENTAKQLKDQKYDLIKVLISL